MELVAVILFALAVYVGLSIVRDIYWDIATRPPKATDEDKKKVLTRKINTVKERIQ